MARILTHGRPKCSFVQENGAPEEIRTPTPRFVVWCLIQLSYGRATGRFKVTAKVDRSRERSPTRQSLTSEPTNCKRGSDDCSVGRRSSVVGRRSSVVGRRSSVVGRRSSVVGRRSSVVGRRSSVVGVKQFRPTEPSSRSRPARHHPQLREIIPLL